MEHGFVPSKAARERLDGLTGTLALALDEGACDDWARAHAALSPLTAPAEGVRCQTMELMGISYLMVFNEGDAEASLTPRDPRYTQVWLPLEDRRFAYRGQAFRLAACQSAVFVAAAEEGLPPYRPDIEMADIPLTVLQSVPETLAAGTERWLLDARFTLEYTDRPVYVRLEGFRECAYVSMNGKKAGNALFAPCRLEVTDHVLPGENSLRIQFLPPSANRFNGANLPWGPGECRVEQEKEHKK